MHVLCLYIHMKIKIDLIHTFDKGNSQSISVSTLVEDMKLIGEWHANQCGENCDNPTIRLDENQAWDEMNNYCIECKMNQGAYNGVFW